MRHPSTRVLAIVALTSLFAVACGGDEGGGNTGAKADSGTATEDTSTGDIGGGEDTTKADTAEADTGTADTGTADTGTADTGTADTGTADTGSKTCPGADGCECKDNGECDSGICLDTHEGKRCAQKCTDTCPTGYACKNIGDGEPLFYCVSARLSLCSPCQFHSDCQVGGVASLCLDYGDAGKFCGSPCTADADCPSDYSCVDAKDGGGTTVKQCKRKDDGGKPGACECSDWAKAKGLETSCKVSNEFGACTAKRKCEASGLSACAAKTPASEVCNTVDDDCDGTTDNLPADFACTQKAFEDAGSKATCKTDSDCTAKGEACDLSDGKCKTLIGACPGKASCNAKGELVCTGAKAPSAEQCNGDDDDCDGQTDEDFAWEDPSKAKLSIGAACGTGACAGGKVVCDGTTKATCDSLSKSKAETCDGVDNDCNGQTDDAACDDSDACTDDLCDGKAGKCTNKPKVDCDDKDVCTEDKCDKATAKCLNTPYEGTCDDGNACTVGDKCGKNPDSGKHTCLPGTEQPKCDDSNPCTDDICDTQKGCLNKPNSGTQPCYTGPKDTKNVGECKEGKSFCKDGKLQGTCDGEIKPKAKEACDGKDATCNGVTDEGCAPKGVAVTFTSARVSGKAGKVDVDVIVGQGGPAGTAAGSKLTLDFGFLAWLKALTK